MKKFSRKLAISLLDPNDYKKRVEKQFEPINSGWVIYWKGNPVKPTGGKNHYFASYEAALQGIDRNISLYSDIRKLLCKKIYGFEFDSKEHEEYFRKDLVWKKNFHEGKHVSNNYRDDKELTPEERVIREEMSNELNQFEGFCGGALKTVLVKAWLADGTLEIKKV